MHIVFSLAVARGLASTVRDVGAVLTHAPILVYALHKASILTSLNVLQIALYFSYFFVLEHFA